MPHFLEARFCGVTPYVFRKFVCVPGRKRLLKTGLVEVNRRLSEISVNFYQGTLGHIPEAALRSHRQENLRSRVDRFYLIRTLVFPPIALIHLCGVVALFSFKLNKMCLNET